MDPVSIKRLVLNGTKPALLCDCINHWKAKNWTPRSLADRNDLAALRLYFRAGYRITHDGETAAKRFKDHPEGNRDNQRRLNTNLLLLTKHC